MIENTGDILINNLSVQEDPLSVRLFQDEARRTIEEEKKGQQLVKKIKDLSEGDLNQVALDSATGRFWLKPILPHLTEKVVGQFSGFYSSKNIYTIYVLTASSLYYQTLNREISVKKAQKKLAEIEKIFGNSLSSYPEIEGGLFNHHFSKPLEEYQTKLSDKFQEPPAVLSMILGKPKNLRASFSSLFNQINHSSRLKLFHH